MLLASPPADAHALLVSADPAEGTSRGSSPRTVTLEFTEEPDAKLSSIHVLDASGSSHERGFPETPPGRERELRVSVSKLGKGVYTVSWRAVSRVDGHYTAGAYAFGVGVKPTEIESAEPHEHRHEPEPFSRTESAGRFLLYIGLAAGTGAAWVGQSLFRGNVPWGSRWLLAGGSLAAAGGVAVLAWAQHAASGAEWEPFLRSHIGVALVERGAFVLLLAVSAAWVLRSGSKGSRLGGWTAMIAGGATMAVHVAAGHARTGNLATLKVAAQFVHFGGMSVWIGGLAALLLSIRGATDETKTRAVRRFSFVAGVMLVLLAGAGTFRAVNEVGSFGALVRTGYGQIVIAKIGLFGVLVLLGARNRWWNVPRAGETFRGLRRVSTAELCIAAAVLTLTAVLSSLAPARSTRLAEPSALVLGGTDFAETVRVRLEITPGFAGANTFALRATTLRGSERVAGVRLRFSSSDSGIEDVALPLERSDDMWTARGSVVSIPGAWRVVVLVDRGVDSAEIPLVFHTRCRAQAPAGGSDPRIYDIDLTGMGSAQAYADPGRPGTNEVHFTFFDEKGKELKVADDPRIGAFQKSPERLDARRFSAGHFVARASLRAGTWIFSFDGKTSSGDALTVCFSDEIR